MVCRRITLLRVGANSTPLISDEQRGAAVVWKADRASVGRDWSAERSVLSTLSAADGVVLDGFGLDAIDTVFRLRALQLLADKGPLGIPSVLFISDNTPPSHLAPGLKGRLAASWPFQSVLFVAEGAAAERLEAEGVDSVSPRLAEQLGLEALFAHPAALASCAQPDQAVALHIQPLWGRCGSSTAFANEIDCLNEAGAFTARIFIDHERRFGGTLSRDFAQLIPENVIDAGPCVDAVACPRIHLPTAADESQADAFERVVRLRTQAVIHDDVVAALAKRADVAIVNHAINVAFAARVSPKAKLVVDTHDYLTRGALERARLTDARQAFPDYRSLRRHLALEARLWRAADVCATVSHAEEARIRRHAPQTLMVFPRPYVKAWSEPGPDATWDLLIVADEHIFNVQSVDWFLQAVVTPNPALRDLRIAIAGQVRRRLEAVWADRLPNVKWLGFVRDLDEMRNRSRLAVCPDRAGTGVSVKALCAIAAGQPMVATSVGLRGMPPSVLEAIPPADTAQAMAHDIEQLIADPRRRAARRDGSHKARDILQVTGSYKAAIELARRPIEAVGEARRALLDEFGAAAAADPAATVARTVFFSFASDGGVEPYLGDGWHEPEVWGRWMDGQRSSLRLPAAWFDQPQMLQFDFLPCDHPVRLEIACRGRTLSAPDLSTSRASTRIQIDPSLLDGTGDAVTLTFTVGAPYCAHEHDGGHDERIRGAGLKAVALIGPASPVAGKVEALDFSLTGCAGPYLGDGWHEPESWGRWVDGARASVHLPAVWFDTPQMVQFNFLPTDRPLGLTVMCGGHRLNPECFSTRRASMRARIGASMKMSDSDMVVVTFETDATWCRHDEDGGGDRRVLGAGLRSIGLFPQALRPPTLNTRLTFANGGDGEPLLGNGWHEAEAWGRWMDGDRASIHLPAAWFETPQTVRFDFMQSRHPVGVTITCAGRRLSAPNVSTRRPSTRIRVHSSMKDAHNAVVTIDLVASATYRPHDHDGGDDWRILGAGLKAVSIGGRAARRVTPQALSFGALGHAAPLLGDGWHDGEAWGRWMDGERATIHLPGAWFDTAKVVEFSFLQSPRPVAVAITCGDTVLAAPRASKPRTVVRVKLDAAMKGQDGAITLNFLATATYCPQDHVGGSDNRILGGGLINLKVRADHTPMKALWNGLRNALSRSAIG
jgi:hypothetical protein